VSDSAVLAEREHASDAGNRRYRLYVPAGTPAGAPLVVWLHGCTQDAAQLAAASRMDALADSAKVIVVYPEQPASANALKCWNWFAREHQARGAGEPAIIASMTREVAREFAADTDHVHIGGISAGGAMAVVAAIAYPDLFASVASHAGIGWRMASDVAGGLAVMKTGGSAADSLGAAAWAAMGPHARVVPLFAVHGMKDVVATPAASRNLAVQFAALARAGGKTLRADSTAGTAGEYAYRRLRYLDEDGRTVIEAWFVDSLGHALSGGAPGMRWVDPRGPDATREMLRFFHEHPRQRR
jgi:poly(hydroxyalkanoate) depolymerase family esterase